MNIAILGCGRWASFHAWYQSKVLGNSTLVWGLDSPMYRDLSKTHKNEYLKLPKDVKFTSDLKVALDFADYVIISISAQAMPEFSANIAKLNPENKTFILCMKGVIDATGDRLTEVLSREVDKSNKIAIWVGPGHVQELVKGQPNIMLIDSRDPEITHDIIEKFKSKLIRFYHGDDLVGAEIGAAAKNVIGIIAGILDGANLTSLKGALMARGIYEVARLIVAMGGKTLTAYGISHLGDFQATLFSENSHNRSYGEKLYKGEREEHLAEGVATSKALELLAKKYKVEMPICHLCYQICYEGKDVDQGFHELFERDNVKEFRF
ncbi:MAG: glycerol-3-phosphate dehydrogenase [Christensenellaceae bacterium]|jgi:glycerol-3-phosphate dehydrogenase (NAD(P)+)|nr:glycerol-3-phosphate dehydrogenase [Christensenellaceae bacterium]